MALNNIVNFPTNTHIDTTNPKLVHGLLATILTKQDPNLIVESNKHQFMDTATPTICTSRVVTITIKKEDIIGSPDHIDFYVTGTVQNQMGQTINCTLYLNLRTNQDDQDIFQNGFHKHPEEEPLVLEFRNGLEQLTDSIFELDLHKLDAHGKKQAIGHGNGYLLFQNEKKTALQHVA